MTYPAIEGPLPLRLGVSLTLLLVLCGLWGWDRHRQQQDAQRRYEDYLRRAQP